jgi:hypothetical protein
MPMCVLPCTFQKRVWRAFDFGVRANDRLIQVRISPPRSIRSRELAPVRYLHMDASAAAQCKEYRFSLCSDFHAIATGINVRLESCLYSHWSKSTAIPSLFFPLPQRRRSHLARTFLPLAVYPMTHAAINVVIL